MVRVRKVPVGLVVVVAVVTIGWAVTAFAATNRFSDVPPDHPFFDEISAIEDACITTGFVDGTFRPGANITRQAEAAFVARAGARVAMDTSTGAVTLGQPDPGISAEIPLLSVTVDVPDFPGCQQYVTIDSSARIISTDSAANTCHALLYCAIHLRLYVDGVSVGQVGEHSFRLNSDRPMATIGTTYVAPLDGGAHTIEVRARSQDVKVNKGGIQPATLVATVTPFGSIQ